MYDPTTINLIYIKNNTTNTKKICNNIDDNYNKTINKDFNTTPKLCNNINNNYNKNIDETFTLFKTTYNNNNKNTYSSGTWTCSPNKLELKYINETKTSKIEICNGFNNNYNTDTSIIIFYTQTTITILIL